MSRTSRAFVAGAVAASGLAVVLIPGPPASAADTVLVPPALTYSPDLSGGPAGQACAGEAVRCVGAGSEYATIQAAVDAAQDGDTVQVAAGSYTENVEVSGKQLSLLGGFAAGFGSRDAAVHTTTVDGGGSGTTLILLDAGDSVVDGFTITGGRAPQDEYDGARGSGIHVDISGAVTISHNLITGNDDGVDNYTCGRCTFGGGIALTSYLDPGISSATISDNVIRDNRATMGGALSANIPALVTGNLILDNAAGGDHGGGMFLSGDGSVLRQNLIQGNTIGDQTALAPDNPYGWGGGAIFSGDDSTSKPHITLEANRWVGNESPSHGGAFFVDEAATATIVGDLFHGNSCHGRGAGVYVDGGQQNGSSATLENVTITGHACADDTPGAGVYAEGGSRVDVTGSVITGNGGSSGIDQCDDCQTTPATTPSTVAYSVVGTTSGSVTRGTGLVGTDPAFVAPASGDFHLAAGSPAIDAADPMATVGAEPASNGGRRNAGAYGGTAEATTSSGPVIDPPGTGDPKPGCAPARGELAAATSDAAVTGDTLARAAQTVRKLKAKAKKAKGVKRKKAKSRLKKATRLRNTAQSAADAAQARLTAAQHAVAQKC